MNEERNSTVSQQSLISTAKRALDKSERDIDEPILDKLRVARKNAVREAQQREHSAPLLRPWLVPASGFAVVALSVGLLFSVWFKDKSEQNFISSIEDIQFLTETEDFTLYEELEFYQWLADEEDIG